MLWSKLSSIARMNASLHYLHGQGPLSLVFQISQHRASKRLPTSNLLSPDELIIIKIKKIIRHGICLSLFAVAQNLQLFLSLSLPHPTPHCQLPIQTFPLPPDQHYGSVSCIRRQKQKTKTMVVGVRVGLCFNILEEHCTP